MWRLRLALILHASSSMLLREALYLFGLWPGPVRSKARAALTPGTEDLNDGRE